MKQSKFNTDASRLTYISKRDHGEEIGDYDPVFYNAFAWATQSAETLRNASQHTDWETICCVQAQSIHCALYGWKQDDIFL